MHPDSQQAFLQYMINHPTCLIKTAARVSQIKYQRATAIWREYRSYIETQRVAARIDNPLDRNQSQGWSENFQEPEASSSPVDPSSLHGQEQVNDVTVTQESQNN